VIQNIFPVVLVTCIYCAEYINQLAAKKWQ